MNGPIASNLATFERVKTMYKTPTQDIEVMYSDICTQVFTVDQSDSYEEITQKIITLANAVHSFDMSDDGYEIWSIGEFTEASLEYFIIGAYWHFTEWHDGQWSSGYAALSALGEVFSPGMSSLDDSSIEYEVYMCLNKLAAFERVNK